MKKKLFAAILTCALAFAMVGCGSETGDTSAASSESGAASETEAGTAASSSSDSSDFRGSVSGTTYTNSYLNISFTSPGSDWMFSDSKDLAARVNKAGEDLEKYTLADIAGGKIFPAMMCTNMKTGESTSLILSSFDQTKDEKTVIEATAKQMEQSIASGDTNLKCEVKEGSRIGSTYYVDISYSQSGVELYMRQYYIFKDGVASTITITSTSQDGLKALDDAWK